MTRFSNITQAPKDPIIGITEAFKADARPGKINLGVGVYTDAIGEVPVLDAVTQAVAHLSTLGRPYAYQPIDGNPRFVAAVNEMLFPETPDVCPTRACTVQALGGTGALQVAAQFLRLAAPDVPVAVSDPTWENHRAIFECAGFQVQSYAYYNPSTRGVDVGAMCESLRKLAPGTIVVLHGCCHNPTGADLTSQDWDRVIDIVVERGHLPIIDLAYAGFASGFVEDLMTLRKCDAAGIEYLVATSFSKNFSLYGERVGALTIVSRERDRLPAILSRLKAGIRTTYSNPPTFGSEIVATVLQSSELRAQWLIELEGMRQRIMKVRIQLRERLERLVPGADLTYVTTQRGMFTYTSASESAIESLCEGYGIYALKTGRICMAAVNDTNIDHVAAGLAQCVVRGVESPQLA